MAEGRHHVFSRASGSCTPLILVDPAAPRQSAADAGLVRPRPGLSQLRRPEQPQRAMPTSRSWSGIAEPDPLATFKYQVYDLRKGEYTPGGRGLDQKRPSEIPGVHCLHAGCRPQRREREDRHRSRWDRSSSASLRSPPPCPGSYSAVRSIAAAGHSNRCRSPSASVNRQTGAVLERSKFLERESRSFPSPHALPSAPSLRSSVRSSRLVCT